MSLLNSCAVYLLTGTKVQILTHKEHSLLASEHTGRDMRVSERERERERETHSLPSEHTDRDKAE